MKAIVVDASLWVARLVEGDAFHALSRAWLDEQRRDGTTFLAPTLLLVEVAAAISRRTGQPNLTKRATQALQRLPHLRLVAMDANLVQKAADLAADLGVRGADAFYIATAHQLGVPLATLDADQAQRAARLLQVLRPNAPPSN